MINWSLKTFRISDLKPYAKNPRTLSQDQYKHLKTSLDTFGLIDKPICTQEGMLIGGHQRIKVLKKDKIKEVECWVPDRDMTEKDIEELNIRLNQTGDFDFELLANNFDVDDLLNWGFDMNDLHIEIPEEAQDLRDEHKKSKICPKCGHEF